MDAPDSLDGRQFSMAAEDELFDRVRILYEDTGATVIYAKREPGEAWSLDQRAILLEDGKITQVDKLKNLYGHPGLTYTASWQYPS